MFQRIQVLVHNPSDIIQKLLFSFRPPIGSFISYLYLPVAVHLFIVPCYYNSYTPSYLPLLYSFTFRHPPSYIPLSPSYIYFLPSFLPFSFHIPFICPSPRHFSLHFLATTGEPLGISSHFVTYS
jgi:hypothetical protein